MRREVSCELFRGRWISTYQNIFSFDTFEKKNRFSLSILESDIVYYSRYSESDIV